MRLPKLVNFVIFNQMLQQNVTIEMLQHSVINLMMKEMYVPYKWTIMPYPDISMVCDSHHQGPFTEAPVF